MARTWRDLARTALRWGRRAAPVLISVGLVVWLVHKVTPARLARTLAEPYWPWLLLATLAQFVVLFAWDTLSLWWVFTRPDRRIPFRVVLRARTDSTLWSAVNLEIGQGAFALTLAEACGFPVAEALGRCVLMGLFDFGCLQGLALVCSFLVTRPWIDWLRWVPVSAVSGLIVLAALWRLAPEKVRRWAAGKTWGNWLTWWTWRHGVLLAAQRLVLFLLVVAYGGVALAICGFPVDLRTAFGVIPFVMVAESLPGTGGLGERETALVYLLGPDEAGQRAVLLGLGLTWSTVVILGRVAVGLVSRALPRRPWRPPDEKAGTSFAPQPDDNGRRRAGSVSDRREALRSLTPPARPQPPTPHGPTDRGEP